MRKKILVIGGTGFIGTSLLKKCKKLNWLLTSVSLHKPLIKDRISGTKYLICDISSLKKLKKTIKSNYDYVVNLGGYIDHINNEKVKKNHLIGPKNLFKIFKERQIKSFIQIGSSTEYGRLKSPQKEDSKICPKDIYGKYKFLATKYYLECYKKFNFPVSIIRFYQIYGPHQKKNRFVPQLINACKTGKTFYTSNGTQSRDFLYIDDAINGIIKCIISPKSKGKIFNIGCGKAVQLKKIMKIVEKKMGNFNPVFGKISLRKNENRVLYPDISKAKKVLKWKNKTTFEKGIDKTIKYYKGK